MNILFIAVNYNSYDKLKSFLDSISLAYCNTLFSQPTTVSVMVADNSTQRQDFKWSNQFINFKLISCENLGYFGGITKGLEILSKDELEQFDFVIISNVDLTIDPSFFKNLISLDLPNNCGWIAPKIISRAENRDKNPKIISRYSKKQIQILELMYHYQILNNFYQATLYKRKKLRPEYKAMEIYAGHGAFIILTREAIEELGGIDYPIFLFGEEQYLGEELLKHKLKVYYEPSLIVYDEEHASTGTLKRKSYYKFNYEALKYILNTYYE